MKIGDKVRIKKWDDMAKQYPVDKFGDIFFPNCKFIDEMKMYCGKNVTVSKTFDNGSFYILEDAEDFEWCEDMIEKEYQPKHMKESVEHPVHYNQGIETIDYIDSWGMNFNRGNIIKYVTRSPYKGKELEDLKKARFYLDREIAKLEK